MKRLNRLPGCLLFLALLAGGGYLWFQHAAPPPVPAPVIRAYTPAEARTARRHVEQARDALLRPTPPSSKPARFGTRKITTVRVQLSEADLNAFLSTDAALQQKLKARGVEAAQVVLRAPNRVDVRAALRVRGQTQNVQVVGTLAPDGTGGVRWNVTGAQAGRVALPLPAVSQRADKLLGPLLHRLPVNVRRVEIDRHNMLVLTGVRR